MGKGDIKSRRGKIWRGSYGKTRKRRSLLRKLKLQKAAAQKKKA
ncbi:MAG TPA: 30S ribosomal protein THX [Microscillaceae bacterium]|jgi:30S ribosomal protein S31|nr:30S ribosomal protein THX [Microscillaceae bacterium]